MAILARSDVDERMKRLNSWTLDGNAIRKQFTFADFPEAIAFLTRLVPGAQAKDFDGAAMADRVALGK